MNVYAEILEKIGPYAKAFVKARTALLDAGLDEKAATDEARTLAMVAVMQPEVAPVTFRLPKEIES